MSHEIIASPLELLCLLINNPIIPPKADNNISDSNEAPEKHIGENHGGILGGTEWPTGTISFSKIHKSWCSCCLHIRPG